ncbi:hypothetical protein [Marinoscillum furvescens]|uniref:Uncharacterized protein n=1 Tax=Marinoscillum furvescens DSM 4134 TaxID=1122208 RepID=A0A3D9KZD3_MARFU|nr:hypothetical protein [Marinoscillum furvescens]RED92218.1 hypothetical protein C7460_13230 [Marinoscillum furvescens DSM 4134]
MIVSIAFVLVLVAVIFVFAQDQNVRRKRIVNGLMIANTGLFLLPLVYAYLASGGGNMWDENGPGVVLWVYMLLLPACGLLQFLLVVLKVVFHFMSKSKAQHEL